MKIAKIYDILDTLSPFELQDEWDNCGLLVGSMHDEIEKIYVGLDIDSALLDEIEAHSLLIVHHPLIFKGLKKIDFTKHPANIIQKAIQKNIAIIAMHTNYDKTHLNRYVLEEVLGFEVKSCVDYLCYFDVDLSFDLFAEKIASTLNLPYIKSVISHEHIKTAALCTGAGASLLGHVAADCLLTGDIKYHEALEAKENGLSLIEIGHYESEVHFGASIQQELQNYGLFAIIANSKNPFRYIT
ncbi:MAG: Nif3-like dinuclear metal center hexameric protein [Epsilonproteobacteria bacterium]|nr:Nif3-like dinuclear metal center hexameric protein [Campylobacterota bacterium]